MELLGDKYRGNYPVKCSKYVVWLFANFSLELFWNFKVGLYID